MSDWTDRWPSCTNCGTTRRYRTWRGHCWLCAPLARRIQKIERGSYRRSNGRHLSASETEFRIRCACRELTELRRLESPLRTGVTGWDIEAALTTLAQVTGVRDYPQAEAYRDYWNSYKIFEEHMAEDGRTRLYGILVDMIEHLPSKATRRLGARRPFWIADEEGFLQDKGRKR